LSIDTNLNKWFNDFNYIVDDIVSRSNIHHCRQGNKKGDKRDRPGCFNENGICKARFPRELVPQTQVDDLTGALIMKKKEAWVNTYTPTLSYLFRCNTDVTSLLSGTAIKAIVAYISDYVTKPGLKTYTVFDTI